MGKKARKQVKKVGKSIASIPKDVAKGGKLVGKSIVKGDIKGVLKGNLDILLPIVDLGGAGRRAVKKSLKPKRNLEKIPNIAIDNPRNTSETGRERQSQRRSLVRVTSTPFGAFFTRSFNPRISRKKLGSF